MPAVQFSISMQQSLAYSWAELESESKLSTVFIVNMAWIHWPKAAGQVQKSSVCIWPQILGFHEYLYLTGLSPTHVSYSLYSHLYQHRETWKFIWIRVVTSDMRSLNPSILHSHQSSSFSHSLFTPKITFQTREQKKRSLFSAAQGPDSPSLSTMPDHAGESHLALL